MNRALPGPIVDLIRDGIPELEVKRNGTEKAARAALIRTANSAVQRGWTRTEWTAEVDRRVNVLSLQIRLTDNGTERTARYVERAYRTAWEEAERWVREDAPPAHDKQTALARVEGITAAAEASDLDGNDRAVMTVALDVARSVGTDRPALPLRLLMEHTGLGMKAVRLALRRLVDAGWLRLEVKGRASPRGGWASLYRLGQPLVAAITEPTTPPTTKDTEDDQMATITIHMSTLTPEDRAAVLAAVRRSEAAPPDEAAPEPLPDNVIPFRRRSA